MKSHFFEFKFINRIASYIVLIAVLAGLFACSKETMNGSGGVSAVNPPPEPPPFTGPDPNKGLPVREMAAKADSYAITYGALDPAAIKTFQSYPLVIVHPYNGNITRSQVAQIKQGLDPADTSKHVVVLCYVSIGEDGRTFGLSDAQMLADKRFAGDGTGPSIDPRGAGAGGTSLLNVDPLGTPTNGGFASYYVNDNAVHCKGAPDKSPDQNGNFNTRFVNAGDPKWYDTVNNMLMDVSSHTPPGLKELLTTTYGRGLGCDGLFLDTIDTAAPNSYTSCTDTNHSNSEWTAKGFTDFVKRLFDEYPDKVILLNRGLFYFDPRHPQYEVSPRGLIDIGFFESYHLDNDSTPVSKYFPNNKYNVAPKLMAEANRPDGFKVLSLGYANSFNGPKPNIDIQTLLGKSTFGLSDLLIDVQEALAVGFRHYITSAPVDFINSFVKDHADMTDTKPPEWSSVYNANYDPPFAPAPRKGIQAAVPVPGNPGSIKVSWDVALDMNKVSYALYYKTSPFDFAADPNMTTATRVVLSPSIGDGYAQVWKDSMPSLFLQSVYPYQQTIAGLRQGVTYYFVLRAFDSKGNEENNQVVLTATP
jgi:hypothetical protein